MSATFFENPDALVQEHMLNPEQLALAQFIEEASLSYIKQVLERMGVKGLTRSDNWQTMEPKLRRQKISVAHMTASEDPTEDGWWLRRGDKAEVHIAHPEPTDDMRLRFRTRYLS
ncbi:MAG TPA: hypothetical protein VFH61_03400 [Thermoleophilia bacterium]|nr:hypothetical protein [Thermoleophilia bacterium]